MPIRTDEIKTTAASAADLTITCGTEKTLVLDEPVWGCKTIQANEIRLPASGFFNPAETELLGGVVLAFSDEVTDEDEVMFNIVSLPSYKEGTDIKFHVHWAGEDDTAGSVRWGLEYTWANVDDAFGASTTIYVDDANGATANHSRAAFAAISGTGKEEASALICRLFRNSSNAADTLTGKDAYLIAVDMRYQIDTMGSRTETAK